MNCFGSWPAATASDFRNSIIDVVVGFSVFSREIDGNVISSYASHASTDPTRMRKRIFVQYHIYEQGGEDFKQIIRYLRTRVHTEFKAPARNLLIRQRVTGMLVEQKER